MNLLRGFAFKKICFLLLIGSSGMSCCLFIPWGEKDKYEKEKIVLEAGVSTKDEVIDQLGEPDVIWEIRGKEEECVFVYKYERLKGYAVFILPYPGNQVSWGPVYEDKALLIVFNEADRVERIDTEKRKAFESYGDFLRRWRRKINEGNNDSEG